MSISEKMMPSGTTLLKRNSQKKYQILIDDEVSNYLKETSLATLAKVRLALLVLIILGTLISYVRKLFLWTAIKIKSRKANASMALRSGISLCLMQINK
jgi:hypothetical protein